MKILYWTAHWGGSAYYRLYLPSVYLKNIPDVKTIFTVDPINEHTVYQLGADVVIIAWPSTQYVTEAIRRMRAKGIKVIIDIDDDIWSISPESPTATPWTDEARYNLEQCMKYANGITVSTEHLKNIVKGRGFDNVAVIENYIDVASFDICTEKMKKDKNTRPRVGWYGSDSHKVDFNNVIVEQLRRLQSDVDFVMYGYAPEALAGKLRGIIGSDPKKFIPILTQLKLDLGLVICDNKIEFNLSKSPLKVWEYIAAGIPVLASDLPVYREILGGEWVIEDESLWYEMIMQRLMYLDEFPLMELQKKLRRDYDIAVKYNDIYKTLKEII